MDDSFFIYLEQLELLLFFSAYPLIYLLIRAIAETNLSKKIFKKNISTLLPYAYALVGILYLGFLLKSFYPDYSFSHIKAATKIPALKIWGLLSIVFFIPAVAKKRVYSLLHSMVFLFFILRDLYFYIFKTVDKSVLKNDMNLYTYSLLINIATFLFVLAIASLYQKLQNRKIAAK
jgi:hypothetical protein